MRTATNLLIIILLSLLLTSCSSRQLGYRYAETLISWQAGNYVSLTDSQDELLRAESQRFLQWHAEQHMPQYYATLSDIYRQLQRSEMGAEDLANYSEELATFWVQIRNELIPPSVALLQSLDDEQVAELLGNMQERLQEQEEELAQVDAEIAAGNASYAQERRAERFLNSFRDYAGRPSSEQEALIQEWSLQTSSLDAQWYAYQVAWHEAFVAALEQRKSSDFAVILGDIYLNPEQFRSAEMQENLALNRTRTVQLMVALEQSLSPRQRERILRRVDRLRRDLRGMMKQREVSV
ncbi:hypothetical protein CWE08_04330 [Aliidiomarina iranensis]|uniref:Lipoprotein n=1 Tax=Aliidiomarina iranensis TaxID=1434071 RepID=A0A432W072_9GAMM|nr:DUF6279 family lipoprotein [Aliidiomarina iranensis]RUO22414.1 hypothetical protein CWE08_04330 [Aliidiomarina iranensis]